MRGVVRGLLAVGAVASLVAGPAGAQQEREPRGAGLALGGFHMLALPEVQKELKLDADQAKKANDLANIMNQRFNIDMNKLKGLNPDEQMKRLPTLAGPHYEEGIRSMRTFLRAEQVDRFDQILFQQRGPMAMLEPNIAKTLRITNEQARKVAEIVADAKNQQKAAFQSAQGDPKAAGPKLRAIAKDASDKALALLDDEQKKRWERLTGAPFDPKPEAGPTP